MPPIRPLSDALSTMLCRLCRLPFTQEHPSQSVCRICVMPRCGVCHVPVQGFRRYCSPMCRQRARAGDRYTILSRDGFMCRVCGHDASDEPQELKKMQTPSWSDGAPTASTTVTLCEKCSLPDPIPDAWVERLTTSNSFFGLDPNRPLRGLSRGAVRRNRRRNHV